jgi:hypothetical protein
LLHIGERARTRYGEAVHCARELLHVRLTLGYHRVRFVGLDRGKLGARLARRGKVDAREPGEEVAIDNRNGIGADRRAAVDADGDLDAVDVLARNRIALDPPHLHAAHRDIAPDLQAFQRLTLEVNRVVAEIRAGSGTRKPRHCQHDSNHQREERRAHARISGFRFQD